MRHLINIFFDSDDLSGLSATKNAGNLILSNALILPKDKEVYGRILSSSVWYDQPNVIAPNNVINFTFNSIPYTLTIAQGIYGVKTIQSRMSELLQNLTLPSQLIVFSSDLSTGLISMQVNRDIYPFIIDFDTDNYLLKNMFGFDLGVVTNPVDGSFIESNTPAQINNISQYHLHMSICNSGYHSGKSGSDVVCVIPILPTSNPGELLSHSPLHPTVFKLNTNVINSIFIRLTTENNVDIITDEIFTGHLELFYY